MTKTWKQKLAESKEPTLSVLSKAMQGVPAGGARLMPTPRLVQAYMDGLPLGTQASLDQLRQALAQQHGADLSCPLTTATAVRTVAEAAWEDLQAGRDPSHVTPFWRVIGPDSKVAQKLSFGTGFISAMRHREGLDAPQTPR